MFWSVILKDFFYSIDKDILFKMMTEAISDRKLLGLTYKLIFEGEGPGIPNRQLH